ncbi:MAG: aliphatic sulfonate ABC transporter substrate-binding protein [Propionibacteriaceae bacterium]|nr:aliphatic sulfonate ABC transporter substrate-binding protein [Propionibacteriaceae bacterium]
MPKVMLISLALLATGFMGGCTTADDKTEDEGLTKVSIAIQPWLGYGAWYIAQEKGFFAENGLDVTLTDFEADADMLAALAGGRVDALNVASHGALLMIESGVEAKIVLLEDAATSADAIITTSEITTVADLKGKKVAYEEGATSDLLLNYALAEAGMTITDIEKVPMGAANAGAAVIAGQVPAAVTYEPYITSALAENSDMHVIYDASAKQGLISDVLMVSDKFAAENADAVKALIASWGQAVDYYNANVEDGRAIIARGVGEDPADLVTAFDGVIFYSLSDNQRLLDGEYRTATLPAVKEVAVTAGLLSGSADPDQAIDAQYLS